MFPKKEKSQIFGGSWLEEETHCTSDKTIIEKLKDSYKSFKTPSETGVEVWIEVNHLEFLLSYSIINIRILFFHY